MKKAFTLVELVLVVVIIGIVSAVMVPRFNRSTIDEAAHQIISHIRYTQHLALMDDVYDPKDLNWSKKRWQIFFANTNGSDDQWAYTIFSDSRGTSTGNPDVKEIAKNPLNPKTYLTGGYSAGTIPYYKDGDENKGLDTRITKEMNLGHKHNIVNMIFQHCGGNSRRIAFDHLGRPLVKNSNTLTGAYRDGSGSHLLQQRCTITMTDSDGKSVQIAIEPETGYAHIL